MAALKAVHCRLHPVTAGWPLPAMLVLPPATAFANAGRWSRRAAVEERPHSRIFSEEPILSLVSSSDWVFVTALWANVGIKGENKKTGERIHYALETPFVMWPVPEATHLPGDLVIFQLGWEQICLLDPKQKKLALIVRDRCAVVGEVPGRLD